MDRVTGLGRIGLHRKTDTAAEHASAWRTDPNPLLP
jgi:hypothetical protein